jgi:CHAT domain-containing protein
MGGKKYIFLLFLSISLLGYCQTSIAQIDPMWWEEVEEKSLYALRQGDYQRALQIAESALNYCRKRKDAAAYYYQGLRFVAEIYESMGNYPMAAKYAEELLVCAEKSEFSRIARPEIDRLYLAKLSMQMASWQKAEQELNLLQTLLGPQIERNPVLYAEVITLLGETYIQQRQYPKAVASFEGAAAILLKQYGKNHLLYADALNRSVYAYMQTGDYEKALYRSEDALKIYQKQGRLQPICAFTLNNMAVSAQRIGRSLIAENYYKEALSIYNNIYGEKHPNSVSIRNNLGILYEQSGKKEKAAALLSQTVEELLVQIDQYYNNVSEVERMHFYRTKIANNIDAFYSFVSRQKEDSLLLQMQEISLNIKNAAIYRSEKLKNIILSEENPELLKIYEEWVHLRQVISQIYGWPQERIKKQRINVHQLELQAEELEGRMAQKSAAISTQFDAKALTTKELQTKLEEGEATLDIIHFHYRKAEGWTDSIMYYALLNKAGEDLPQLIPLSTSKKLRAIMRREVGLDPISGQQRNSYISNKSLNDRLYQAVWAAIEPQLKGIKRIHLAPSGWLCQLSFGSLQDPEGNYLSDRYDLRYYGAMRDFIYPNFGVKEDDEVKTAVVFGGIDFDAKLEAETHITTALEGGQNSSADLFSQSSISSWEALPASKKEAELIAGKLENKGISCRLLMGVEAREDSLKSFLLKKAPTILHLATHAYFIAAASRNVAEDELQVLRDKLQYEPHPLWRSGLLLSGANAAWMGGQTIAGLKDGILPAYDVAAMNLQQTELVVLSACQTGRGDVDNTEGVQGLQSAFRQAGVRYQLLTLWKVSDEASAKMMELFYDYYLSGESIPIAFQKARKALREITEFSSPFYWGAFILME